MQSVPNVYRYCRNDPFAFIDPTGLADTPASFRTDFDVKYQGKVYLKVVLLLDSVSTNRTYADVRARVRVRRPIELPGFRGYWNELDYLVPDYWGREIWNTDDITDPNRWLWPNLSALFSMKEPRYGGWDPGKEIDNDYMAVVIRHFDKDGRRERESTSNGKALISAIWHPIGKGADSSDLRTVIHVAGVEEFRLHVPCDEGLYKIWVIMADLFEDQLYSDAHPEGPTDKYGDAAGGPIAYFALKYRYNGKVFSPTVTTPTTAIPATQFDWDNWDGASNLREK